MHLSTNLGSAGLVLIGTISGAVTFNLIILGVISGADVLYKRLNQQDLHIQVILIYYQNSEIV